jgi:hypothetical protein
MPIPVAMPRFSDADMLPPRIDFRRLITLPCHLLPDAADISHVIFADIAG